MQELNTDQSAKADGGKTDPTLLAKDMAPAVYLVQRVLDYGLVKYSRGSWKMVDWQRWDAAQRRHQQKIDLGHRADDESDLLHRAHQVAGLMIMLMQEIDALVEETGVTLEELGNFKDPPQDHKKQDAREFLGTLPEEVKKHLSFAHTALAYVHDLDMDTFIRACELREGLPMHSGTFSRVENAGQGDTVSSISTWEQEIGGKAVVTFTAMRDYVVVQITDAVVNVLCDDGVHRWVNRSRFW